MSRFRVEILRKANLEWIFFEYIENDSMLEASGIAKTDFEEFSRSESEEYTDFRLLTDRGIECLQCMTRDYPERIKMGESPIKISEYRSSDIVLKCSFCETLIPVTRKELEL